MPKSNNDAPLIDATSEPIQSFDGQLRQEPNADPALATTVALANELRHIYANNNAKLEAANRLLRQAIRPKQ